MQFICVGVFFAGKHMSDYKAPKAAGNGIHGFQMFYLQTGNTQPVCNFSSAVGITHKITKP
jgi:hypothetical protein